MSDLSLAILGLVAAAWLAAAGWAVWMGLGHRRRARATEATNRRLGLLLERSPAMPMLVRMDDSVEGSERLAQRLGLDAAPDFLSELSAADGGLTPADLEALTADVRSTQRSGRAWERVVSPAGSTRRLLIAGAPASRALVPGGGALMWVSDVTPVQSRLDEAEARHATLDRSYRALSAVIEEAPFPIWHRDGGGSLRLVNRAYVEAVEGDEADAVVEAGTELLDAAAGETPAQVAARALDTGRAVSRTLPATVGHQRRTLQVTDVPLGKLGVAGFAFDVDDREEAIASVRRFTDAQRTMLDRMSAGVIQFAPDRSLSFANEPFRRIFALDGNVSVGMGFDRLFDAMREAGRLPPARDFPAFKAERGGWFQARAPEEESWHLDDGTFLRVVPQPLPDGALLVVFEDRTEEARLAGARDTLIQVRAATFDSLFEAVAVVSSDGRLTLTNERYRELWNLDPELLAEQPRLDEHLRALSEAMARGDDARDLLHLVRRAANERESGSATLQLADGRVLRAAGVPLPDGNALLTLLDVTDARRVERALRDQAGALQESDRVKTAFVETVSYELRTPLTTISGFAEMLAEGIGVEVDAAAVGYAAAIGEAAVRLGELIDNVLDLTAGAAGRLAGESAPVDLAWLLADMAAGATTRAEAAGLTFVSQLPDDLPTLSGDAARLRKAVGHLLDNALRYTPAGGRVLLHADTDGARARVIVSDDGPGMAEREAARALEMFSTVDPVRGRDGALGIGLPVARQIALAHGGTLTVHSEEGVGTMAVLELPLDG